MKLYATTTSERASKGQGGNKFLNIEILCGSEADRHKLAEITVNIQENEIRKGEDVNVFQVWNYDVLIDELEIPITKQKGKKKKDEICTCGSSELPTVHKKRDCKNPF